MITSIILQENESWYPDCIKCLITTTWENGSLISTGCHCCKESSIYSAHSSTSSASDCCADPVCASYSDHWSPLPTFCRSWRSTSSRNKSQILRASQLRRVCSQTLEQATTFTSGHNTDAESVLYQAKERLIYLVRPIDAHSWLLRL